MALSALQSPEFIEFKRDARRFVRTIIDGALVQRRTPRTPAAEVLVFPPDPWDVFGSLGDDAMLSVVAAHFRTANPAVRFHFFCHGPAAASAISRLGHRSVELPSIHTFPQTARRLFEENGYDAFVAVGADVMDGHYNTVIPRQMLIAADLAARSGIPVTVTGFSFNENPATELRKYFAHLSPRVGLNVRDPVSLARLGKFARTHAQLSADAAFLLEPAPVGDATSAWIDERRAAGRLVVGFNLHPMLFARRDRTVMDRALVEVADAIETATARYGADWLFIPHDYRGDGIGDEAVLRELFGLLEANGKATVRYFEGAHSAAALKGLASALDAVVTARMHLAIAALGTGTPVACFGYQGKFAGLLDHFGLPHELLGNADLFDRPGACSAMIGLFLANLPEWRAQVSRRLPEVMALAGRTFAR